MLRQAIVTKFLGPTDRRGSRIKASAWAGSMTIDKDHSLNVEQGHAKAARALAEKLGWCGVIHQGGMPDGDGYVFVFENPTFEVKAGE